MNRQPIRRRIHTLLATLALVSLAAAASPARAQDTEDYLGQANAASAAVTGTRNATPILFDTLIEMEAPDGIVIPEGFYPHAQMSHMLLMGPQDPGWSAAVAWAEAEPQKKVLEAVKTITDPEKKYQLGLPLGRTASDQRYIDAGLWIDLGEPELLADAEFIYGARFETVFYLLSVEAERRALADDGEGAMEVLADWIRLARMWTMRPFASETIRGIMQMCYGMERLRDIAFTYPDLFDDQQYEDFIKKELDEKVIEERQIRFPRGDFIALRELAQKTIDFRGGPNARFPLLMARVTTRDRPLRLFQEAAHWQTLAAGHATWFDVQDEIARIEGDWRKRWDLGFIRDPLHRKITDYQRSDKAAYAMFEPVIDPLENLFWMRLYFYAQIGGTRTALGLAAFRNDNGQIPLTAKAIQPRYRRVIDNDPFTWDGRARGTGLLEGPTDGRELPFGFFVPIRDVNWGPRDIPSPHTMTIYSYYLDPMLMLSNVRYTTFPNMLEGGPTGPDSLPGGVSVAFFVQRIARSFGLTALNADNFRDIIVELGNLPPETLNWETMEADLPAVREKALEVVQNMPIDRDLKRGIEAVAAVIAQDAGRFSVDQIDAIPDAEVARRQQNSWYRISTGLYNLDFEGRTGVRITVLNRMMNSYYAHMAKTGVLKDIVKLGLRNQKVSDAYVMQSRRAFVESFFQPDVWAALKEAVTQFRNGPAGAEFKDMITQFRSGQASSESPVFAFSIDDSQFILYSVGWDGVGERAATVHPLKGDILIWPPVLSLTKLNSQGINVFGESLGPDAPPAPTE